MAVINRAEEQGQWPSMLLHALVAMLPKLGTGQVGDFRPITLLSTLYRVWAKGHSGAFRCCLLLAVGVRACLPACPAVRRRKGVKC